LGLTQQIGASSLIKPGVIDNTAARPASPYEGQIIFQKDTDQLLVWNGTAWVIPNSPAQNPQGLELVQSQTISSSVSYLEMLNVFSASYDNYRVVINNIQSTSSLGMCFYLGTNSTSGLYYGSLYYDQFGGGATSTFRSNGLNIGYVGLTDSAGANGGYSFDLNAPYLTKQKTYHGTYDGRNFAGWCGGLIASSSSFTGIRFLNETGNLTAGTIRIYGYRNS